MYIFLLTFMTFFCCLQSMDIQPSSKKRNASLANLLNHNLQVEVEEYYCRPNKIILREIEPPSDAITLAKLLTAQEKSGFKDVHKAAITTLLNRLKEPQKEILQAINVLLNNGANFETIGTLFDKLETINDRIKNLTLR